MKPNWLISNNCYSDGNPELMITAAQNDGSIVHSFKYVPFEVDQRQKLHFEKEACVIAYGSIELVKLLQRRTAWHPGAWVDWDKLRCQHYLAHWGSFSIHYDYGFLPLAEVRRQKERIFNYYGEADKVFFRPDTNSKGYAGQGFYAEVVHRDNWDNFEKEGLNYPEAVQPETLTMFSRPSTILKEWRMVIGDKKVVTGSQYREMIDGQSSVELKPEYPTDIVEFCETIAQSGTFQPAAMYTIDVGLTKEHGLRMVEIGGWNCSGLYCCDIEKIVKKANEIAAREFSEINDN